MSPYAPVTGYPQLPAGYRVTAYWWAVRRGLPADFGYLLELGRLAARIAWWEGLEPARIAEGPLIVHSWPDWIWIAAEECLRGDRG